MWNPHHGDSFTSNILIKDFSWVLAWSENDAKQLLEQHFNKKDAILKKKKQTNIELLEQDPNRNTFANENDVFARFNALQSTEERKELEVYINNMDWLQGPNLKDPKSLLIWWKVFIY